MECMDPDLPGFKTTTFGACEQSEVCITQGSSEDDDLVAVCVPQQAELRILEATRNAELRRVTADFDGPGPSGHANVAIALTGQNDDILFQASAIDMAPRDSSNNPLAASSSCTQCSELNFLKSPPNTANFDINITMPHANDITNLHDILWFS
ncbi:MAG: hypothetical protein M1822_009033 [Bathelium mastoideum]|nr:MAG: hypothetical protein M1822_009033 [Bathelium mastoideum]